MFIKLIVEYLKLMRFMILPVILGVITCLLYPSNAALLKTTLGVVIGCAIQHRYMAPAIKSVMDAYEEFLEKMFDDDK